MRQGECTAESNGSRLPGNLYMVPLSVAAVAAVVVAVAAVVVAVVAVVAAVVAVVVVVAAVVAVVAVVVVAAVVVAAAVVAVAVVAAAVVADVIVIFALQKGEMNRHRYLGTYLQMTIDFHLRMIAVDWQHLHQQILDQRA